MKATTREKSALIRAGRSLALRYALPDVDPLRIASEARLPPETFEQHFDGIPAYVAAVQQQFMDEIRDKILKVTAGMKPGLPRIKLATEAYLESCLNERALCRWLLDNRTRGPLSDAVRRQNQPYSMVVVAELKALHWPHPREAARLYVAMTNEASRAEHHMGQSIADLRDTLWDFLESCSPGRRPATDLL